MRRFPSSATRAGREEICAHCAGLGSCFDAALTAQLKSFYDITRARLRLSIEIERGRRTREENARLWRMAGFDLRDVA